MQPTRVFRAFAIAASVGLVIALTGCDDSDSNADNDNGNAQNNNNTPGTDSNANPGDTNTPGTDSNANPGDTNTPGTDSNANPGDTNTPGTDNDSNGTDPDSDPILDTDTGAPIDTDDFGDWYRDVPEPLRVRYASPDGTGDGMSQETPMELQNAVSQSQPGDLIWLLAGDYTATGAIPRYEFDQDGTASAPIIYRALPGARARIFGGTRVSGAYNWLWGLEITDPNTILEDDPAMCIGTYNRGIVLINNVLHNEGYYTSLSSWNFPEQLVYGNIVYSGLHNIYTQNTAENGYRYFVHNISLDAQPYPDGEGGQFAFHAYAEGGDISGMYLEGNAFANTGSKRARTLIGAKNSTPNDREVLIGNYFYNAELQLGFARPVQATVKDNYFYEGLFEYKYFWGEGEIRFDNIAPIVVTGNTIYQSGGTQTHIDLRTSAYTGEDRSDGVPTLRAGDTWDNNTYGPSLRADLYANGSQVFCGGLANWRTATESAGNRFDANSTEGPVPTTPHVALLPNAYESGRGHLIIYNYGNTATVPVDLAAVCASGKAVRIHHAKDAYANPVFSGTYEGANIDVPVPAPFAAYLVLCQ
ncbi:MAG: hypothetical protein GX146_12205 [Myxococcales bacterium]|nr:hypothetical protein [Myxococcales bacterium]